ncbi:MAG: hypothetical protein JNK78_01105 [Planctomycetes bacterium]|nr:hypothetical protein [Planctomycetota bacterium]
MSLELRTVLEDRLTRLKGNEDAVAPIVARRSGPPAPEDLAGLAWLLESSYSDIEEAWKAIARHFEEPTPTSTSWHRDLLDSMANQSRRRGPVISTDLRDSLEEYLSFRHFSRYSTFAILRWDQMQPLVERLPTAIAGFRCAIERLLGPTV